jgi:hypothetical protein
MPAIGFDVNPALAVVSRARLLGAGVWASIDPLGEDVVAHAASVELDEDPLRFWFSQQAAGSIRGLQQSMHRLLVDSGTASQAAFEGAPGMSTLAAFFYTVLFRTVRVLIAPRAGTNPTWWKRVEEADRLGPSREEIMTQFRASATELAAGLHRDNYDGGVDIRVGLGDSRRLPLEDGAVDAVVSSPPYCTRIDYGVATRPELAVLGAGEEDIKFLRDRMVGTPTMTGERGTPALWGESATVRADLPVPRAAPHLDLSVHHPLGELPDHLPQHVRARRRRRLPGRVPGTGTTSPAATSLSFVAPKPLRRIARLATSLHGATRRNPANQSHQYRLPIHHCCGRERHER